MRLPLDAIELLDGGREYMTAHWMTDEHKKLMASDWENRDAFAGNKYDFYAGYGKCIQPKSIFEVGVFMGYSIATMLWGARGSVETVTLMDIDEQVHRTRKSLLAEFPMVHFTALWMDSKNVNCVLTQHDAPGFDIVHIDGDHTYEYAHSDLFNFGPMVSKNGLIVVDDAKDPAVLRACEEFKSEYDMDSRFIDNYNGHFLLARKP